MRDDQEPGPVADGQVGHERRQLGRLWTLQTRRRNTPEKPSNVNAEELSNVKVAAEVEASVHYEKPDGSDYDRRAQEAEGLARQARSDDERKAHLDVARIWRELAGRRAAKRTPNEP